MRLLIENVNAYINETLEETRTHLYVDDKGLLEVHPLSPESETWLNTKRKAADLIVDGTALTAAPSFFDLHVHFREPGFEHKETLVTGQLASIKGGVTGVCPMPNTKPCIDRPDRLVNLNERIHQNPLIDVFPVAAITLNQAGTDITDLLKMTELGAAAYSDDGRTVMDAAILEQALKISGQTGCPVMTHSEDHDEAAKYPDRPYPPEVEGDIVRRDIGILEKVGGKLHIAHLSTRQALEAVLDGKRKNLNVTYEIAPHHLYFNADELSFDTAKYKVNPPLRNLEHIRPLIDSIKKGYCDAIASDHAPHEPESKTKPYKEGSYGFTGIETMFSVVNTVFQREDIDFKTLIELMAVKPRRILGHEVPYLESGKPATFVLVNTKKDWLVTEDSLISKSKNSPLIGHTLKGTVDYVVFKGALLLKEGYIHVK